MNKTIFHATDQNEPDTGLDPVKLVHWMNIRKVTWDHLATHLDAEPADLRARLRYQSGSPRQGEIEAVATFLNVDPTLISAKTKARPAILLMRAAELRASCRAVQRDGIHFYNYYSLPVPAGSVGPVILDILCPK